MSEINIKTSGSVGLDSTRAVKVQDKGEGAKTQSESTVSDKVTLTDSATQLQASVQKVIAEAPEVNSERVDALRAIIADGTYSVDATELAKNLINFEQQLLS